MAVLAVLTLQTARQLIHIRLKWLRMLPGLSLAALLGALSFILHQSSAYQPSLGLLIVYEAFIAGLFFVVMWMLRSSWVGFLLNTMFVQSSIKREAVG